MRLALLIIALAATPAAADDISPLFGSTEMEPFRMILLPQTGVQRTAGGTGTDWTPCLQSDCPHPLKLANGAQDVAAAP